VAKTLEFAAPRGLMLRHLVLPGHVECCTQPVLAWLQQAYPTVPRNVMDHYLPLGPARTTALPRAPELRRILNPDDLVSLAALRRVRQGQ
jgi:putative pyruvate formate lyase activating enzyme